MYITNRLSTSPPPPTSAEAAQADLLTSVEYQPTFLEVIRGFHKGFYLKRGYWSAIYERNPMRDLRLEVDGDWYHYKQFIMSRQLSKS